MKKTFDTRTWVYCTTPPVNGNGKTSEYFFILFKLCTINCYNTRKWYFFILGSTKTEDNPSKLQTSEVCGYRILCFKTLCVQ